MLVIVRAVSDGDFVPAWNKIGKITGDSTSKGGCPSAYYRFMDLNGDGIKDIACVNKKTSQVSVLLNKLDSNGHVTSDWSGSQVDNVKSGIGKSGEAVFFAE